MLPRQGRALDLASGRGRIARFALARGLEVTAVDVSPVGLAHIRRTAPEILTVEQDLGVDPTLPDGPFVWISCFHYRDPSLWPHMIRALSPGGVLVAELFTTTNLERHPHPSRRWLVEPGDLRRWASPLAIVWSEEGWHGDRHSARIIAKKS